MVCFSSRDPLGRFQGLDLSPNIPGCSTFQLKNGYLMSDSFHSKNPLLIIAFLVRDHLTEFYVSEYAASEKGSFAVYFPDLVFSDLDGKNATRMQRPCSRLP